MRGERMAMATGRELHALIELIAGGNLVILTGAGMSTDSGIPDYRGPDGQRRVQPMTIAEFRATSRNRQRYWARAFVGWDRFRAARPNPAHLGVTELQRRGLAGTVITQNVDGLHQAAGSTGVVELHGTLAQVRCLRCGRLTSRSAVQAQLASRNPGYVELTADAVAQRRVIQPDGDVALPDDVVTAFHPPHCEACGSDEMKPDVVFFGDCVPRARVQECAAAVEAARALLVLGSSLQVMSGLRFVRQASRQGLPVGLITRGSTRGDDLVSARVDAALAPTLAAVLAGLDGRTGRSAGPAGQPGREAAPTTRLRAAAAPPSPSQGSWRIDRR